MVLFASRRVLLIALLVGLMCQQVKATTYHVSPHGSDTPPYDTYAKAALRISDASSIATQMGDTILVHSGEYIVDSSLFIQRGVSWVGVDRDSVTVVWADSNYGTTYLARLLGQNEIAGMEFQYPAGRFNFVAYALWANTFPEPDTIAIHHCRFYDFKPVFGGNAHAFLDSNEHYHGQAEGIEVTSSYAEITNSLFSGALNGYGVSVFGGGVVTIERNVFDNTLTSQVFLNRQQAAVHVIGAAQVTVRNNIVRWARRPFVWYYANGVIENNSFIDTGDPNPDPLNIQDHSWFFQRHDETLVIRNNLFDNSARMQFGLSCVGCDSTGWINLEHNAYWPPVDSFFAYYPGDPPERIKVFDSANANAFAMLDSSFRLQANSPLIDAGDPSILDVDGTTADIGWTGGPGGLEYEYTNLAPEAPESLMATADGNVVHLNWSSRPEADLDHYAIYRDVFSGFWTPGLTPLNTIPASDTTTVDTLLSANESYFYVVTAVDAAGLESEPSPEVEHLVTGVSDLDDDAVVPRRFGIVRTYPNPFNANLMIEYSMPETAVGRPVMLEVYNALGQRVASLDAGSSTPGLHRFAWSLDTRDGSTLSSGVYAVRLRVGGVEVGRTVKVVLLK